MCSCPRRAVLVCGLRRGLFSIQTYKPLNLQTSKLPNFQTSKPPTMSTPDSSPKKPEVSALTPEHVIVITELAKAGLSYLTQVVSDPDFKLNHPDPAVAKAQEEHLRNLVSVSGPDTVAHFDRMCGYLCDLAKKSATPTEKGAQ